MKVRLVSKGILFINERIDSSLPDYPKNTPSMKIYKTIWYQNFINEPTGYVARFYDKTYEEWLYRRQNFYTIFTDEMRSLVNDFQPLFEIKSNTHPKLLQEYLGKRISLETLIILDELVSYANNWDKEMAGDLFGRLKKLWIITKGLDNSC